MKKALKRFKREIYYYKDGQRVEGPHLGISGDVSDIRGDVTGIRGEVTGISGDLDKCEITGEERKQGVDVDDLVGE